MNFTGVLFGNMERSSAGSEQTSRQVLSMLSGGKKALYFGDEAVTPAVLREAGYDVTALITDENRAEKAGAQFVKSYEIPESAAECDVFWCASAAEVEAPAVRLSQLKERCKKGGVVVYRTLCWLIEPSPDTVSFCKKRFGIITPLDKVLLAAKQAGFAVQDFYISPRSDWTDGSYRPLLKAAEDFICLHEEEASSVGMRELQKEADMFELHCEEYSYVYYILKG